jgi:L-iditol 2-dehydrogenase
MGIVEEIGESVTTVQVGDAVTVLPQAVCGACECCKNNLPQHCKERKAPGTNEWLGTFVEYFNAPQHVVYKLPEGMDDILGVLAEPLAVAFHAVKKFEKKDSLLILGSGTIGMFALMAAKRLGFSQVVLTDTMDYNLSLAIKNGADFTVNVLKEQLGKVLEEKTKTGSMQGVLVTASAPNIMDQALESCSANGRIVYLPMILKPLEIHSYSIVYKELTIFGSLNYNEQDFMDALLLLKEKSEVFSSFITNNDNYTDTQKAFDRMKNKEHGFVKNIIHF